MVREFMQNYRFLSTPSARRATILLESVLEGSAISIHALREEGDRFTPPRLQVVTGISIHALREEGDGGLVSAVSTERVFLSTPSARRATGAGDALQLVCKISIHALREEGDLYLFDGHFLGFVISIHALREEGDHRGRDRIHAPHISIHALREEGD